MKIRIIVTIDLFLNRVTTFYVNKIIKKKTKQNNDN